MPDIYRSGNFLYMIGNDGKVIKINMAEEFHVHTPKDDGGAKKKKKYGWMTDQYGIPIAPSDLELKKKLQARSLDAVFIGTSMLRAAEFAKRLNYKTENVIMASPTSYHYKLCGVVKDEDLPVYVVGAWPDVKLAELRDFLAFYGFDWMEVTEIV